MFMEFAQAKGIELHRDDIKFIREMIRLHPREQRKAIAHKYIATWLNEMNKCNNVCVPQIRQNLGRKAANSYLRTLSEHQTM